MAEIFVLDYDGVRDGEVALLTQIVEVGDSADISSARHLKNGFEKTLPYNNANSPGLTPIGPPMWQAEADRKLTLSALPATAVDQLTLTLAN